MSARGFAQHHGSKQASKDPDHRLIYARQVEPLRQLGRLANAEPILRLLLQDRTTLPQVYRDLAELARERGQEQHARCWTDHWLQLDSDQPDQRLQQACAALQLNRPQVAQRHLAALLQLDPGHPGGLLEAGRLALLQGRCGQALAHLELQLAMDQAPTAEALASAALCAIELGRTKEAERWAHDCLALAEATPWQLVAVAVQARLLQARGQEAKALTLAQQALRNPQAAWPVSRVVAPLLLEQQQLAVLQPVLAQALQHQSDDAWLHMLQAELHWLQGSMQAGFAAYQWRQPALHGCRLPAYAQGCNTAPLVLVAEGTLGDTLLFSRYAPWLQQRLDMPVCLVVQPPLLGLMQANLGHQLRVESFAALRTLCQGQVLPLLSAPALFGTCQEHAELGHSHLQAPDDLVEHWRARLGLEAGQRLIGLNWHGSALQSLSERHCSNIPLQQLAPLARLPKVRLLSLQKGMGAKQLEGCSFAEAFVEVQEAVNREHRLEHIAALMSLCDWVVADDSGPAHMAGCLGLRTLVLLPERINWRWAARGPVPPWYPNTRLVQQQAYDWTPAVREACDLIG